MTHEEMNMLYSDLHSLSHNFMERLKHATDPAQKLSLTEMAMLSCVMKDLANAAKDVAKAHYYSHEHPVETGKKF